MKYLYPILFLLFCAACSELDKNTPLPETDLTSRNAELQEVKKQLDVLRSATTTQALAMLEHPDYRVRRAAIKRLSKLKAAPKPAVDALLRSLTDENENVRIEAAIALTFIESERAVGPLIHALVDDNSKVRQWSYKALKKLGNKAVPAMVDQLNISPDAGESQEPDSRVQEILMDTLSGMGKAAVPYLIKALEKNQTASAKEAVELLGKIGKDAKESIYVLLEILNSDSDIELKKSTINAISNIGDVDPEVVPTLFQFVEGNNPSLAAAAKRALEKLDE